MVENTVSPPLKLLAGSEAFCDTSMPGITPRSIAPHGRTSGEQKLLDKERKSNKRSLAKADLRELRSSLTGDMRCGWIIHSFEVGFLIIYVYCDDFQSKIQTCGRTVLFHGRKSLRWLATKL